MPRRIRNHETTQADIALQLGNCFVWISGKLDTGPAIEQPLRESPSSIYALGKHFRAVALELMDEKDAGPPAIVTVQHLESEMRGLELRLQFLERKAAQKGGKL